MNKVYADARAALAGVLKDGMMIMPAVSACAAFRRP